MELSHPALDALEELLYDKGYLLIITGTRDSDDRELVVEAIGGTPRDRLSVSATDLATAIHKLNGTRQECARCNRMLPVQQFSRQAGTRYGKGGYCKECVEKYHRERRGE